jgi:hypothetical protein
LQQKAGQEPVRCDPERPLALLDPDDHSVAVDIAPGMSEQEYSNLVVASMAHGGHHR